MSCRHSRQVKGKEDTTIYLMCERIHFKSEFAEYNPGRTN